MAEAGFPARGVIELLGVSQSGYYAWRDRTPSARALRHAWLTRILLDIHRSSGSTFGYRRLRQELGRRYGITVSHGTVELLMNRAGIRGRPGRLHESTPPAPAGAPSRRWVIDVSSGATPNGTWCAAVVLEATTHHLVGFSTGPEKTALLVDRALTAAMAQEAAADPVPDATEGHLTGCFFTRRTHTLRHASASGTIGDWYDHALAEAFWETVRRELTGHHDGQHPERPEERLLEILERLTRRK
ncbi:IS3 family transposase [Streptomyces sp. JNUCC 63]